jgi:ubiquinone/menaquinone biosynthesis C-methylase UbiE
MPEAINFDKVADLYDFYVKADFDIPFFLKEAGGFKREILELMCGTGRVSIPLLEAHHRLTCVDCSQAMLDVLADKILTRHFPVHLVRMDVTELGLGKKFGLILAPFHGFSEIISAEGQRRALKAVARHLEKEGHFICTLQNPTLRLREADGCLHVLGQFPAGGNTMLVVSYTNRYDAATGLVSGWQFYELYNHLNVLTEKRFLEINFRPVSKQEFEDLLQGLHLEVESLYGDYEYSPFDEDQSSYMIYKLRKT